MDNLAPQDLVGLSDMPDPLDLRVMREPQERWGPRDPLALWERMEALGCLVNLDKRDTGGSLEPLVLMGREATREVRVQQDQQEELAL